LYLELLWRGVWRYQRGNQNR